MLLNPKMQRELQKRTHEDPFGLEPPGKIKLTKKIKEKEKIIVEQLIEHEKKIMKNENTQKLQKRLERCK